MLSSQRSAALEQYRARANFYDFELALLEPMRVQAIASLDLRPGETVLDIGCGTGLSFEALHAGVGARGRIVGVEQCPEMLEQARQRVARHGWKNLSLLCAPAESAKLSAKADAALFHFTHDILRQPEAIANVLRHLKPGARVVASGLKWVEPWGWPLNFFVLAAALHSMTTLEGLAQPWDRIAAQLNGLKLQATLGGGGYIASGVARGQKPALKPQAA